MQEREAAGVLRDTEAIRTPFYVVDETLLKKNLEILKDTAERAGCRILLAQKAFSMYSVYPLIRQYLSGTAASGLYEARLGKTEFGGETHVFSAAYRPDEFDEILNYAEAIRDAEAFVIAAEATEAPAPASAMNIPAKKPSISI